MRCRKPGDIGFTKTSQTPCSIRLVVHEPEIFARPQENSGKSRPLRAFGHIGSITRPKKPLCPRRINAAGKSVVGVKNANRADRITSVVVMACGRLVGVCFGRGACHAIWLAQHTISSSFSRVPAGARICSVPLPPQCVARPKQRIFTCYGQGGWTRRKTNHPGTEQRKSSGSPAEEKEEKRIRAEEQTTRGGRTPLKASGCSARAANGLRRSSSGKIATARLCRLDAASPATWLGR